MKLVKQAFLYFQDEKSDKVYEVDLCELSQQDDERYLVNFRYGRRGTALRDGTKTVKPVILEDAEAIFASIIVSKTNKGYLNSDNSSSDEVRVSDTETKHIELQDSNLPSQMTDKILSRLSLLAHQKKFNTVDFKRLVWRIGELGITGADELMLSAGNEGDGLLDYCLLWSLGRVGQDSESLYPIFEARYQQSEHAAVQRIAFEAMMQHASAQQRTDQLSAIRQKLDATISAYIEQTNFDALYEYLQGAIQNPKQELSITIYNLYLLSLENQSLLELLLRLLPAIPARPNTFKALRYIYKAAEFRNDYQVLGVVALVMECSRPYVFHTGYESGYVWLQEEWLRVKISEEAAKDNSRLAWTDNTRNYFRLRTWRNLRRLGKVSHASFVDHATGILLAFEDTHGNKGYSDTRYRKVDNGTQWGSYELFKVEYSAFSPYTSYNNLLYGNSQRLRPEKSGRAWSVQTNVSNFRPLTEGIGVREELFPELWDKRPDALIHLLCKSKCLQVHLFATRALEDNISAYQNITTNHIIAFLSHPYRCTNSLAMQLAQQQFTDTNDIELIEAMLGASISEARELGQSWLNAHQHLLDEHPKLLISILTSKFSDIQEWARELVVSLNMDLTRKQAVVARLFAWIQGLAKCGDNPERLIDGQLTIVTEITWHLTHTFKQQSATIGLDVIEDLLSHPLLEIKKLAGELLVNHQTPTEQLPTHLLQILIENNDPELRALGVKLFAQLPVKLLVEQHELVLAYCLSDQSAIRQASFPIISRFAESHQIEAEKIIRHLLDQLFKKESSEGLHDDVINALSGKLSELISTSNINQSEQACVVFDKEVVWRLLLARSNAANRYGGHLLALIEPEQFTVRQWSRLGMNPVFSVRAWVWSCYNKYCERIKQNAVDGLRILESRWDDTRAFAIDYFRNQFSDTDWTPETMIGVCDSVEEDVQQLGRELITQFFDDEHGIEYLDKLSQHPSVNVQLFTSNYLTNYAGGSLKRIEALSPYFVTVLSHVNKARVAKARVIEFLHLQAMQSSEIAKVAAKIFSRQSVTIILADHTRYLLAMRDLQDKYPFLDLPIAKRAVPIRSRFDGQLATIEKETKDHAV